MKRLASWLKRNDVAAIAEYMRRQRVADFIVDYRALCENIGPWQYAADLGAHSEAELRHIAYLAVWRDGPTLRIWQDVCELDAIDLVLDAAVEGFEAYLVAHPAEA